MIGKIFIAFSWTFLLFLFSCGDRNHLAEWPAERAYTKDIPAVVSIPISWNEGMLLSDHDNRLRRPLQVLDRSRALFVPNRNINIGETLTLLSGEIDHNSNECVIEQVDGKIIARWKDQEILSYAIEAQLPSDTLPSYYQRSGFIHPLKTGGGNTITDGFPQGHTHQHGVFNAWTRSHFRGEMIDFWNQQEELGTIQHLEVLAIQNGPVFSSFSVTLQPLAYIKGDTVASLTERWTVRIIPLHDNYLIDWSIEQKGNGKDTLIIDEYHYGGAAFRGSKDWNSEEGAYDSKVFFTTNELKSHLDGNHSRPIWAALYGRVPESFAGVAMMGHPTNFRHPQPIRVHPKMPYFCFAPMVLGSFSIAPDDTYRSRYALFIYDGRPDAKRITQIQEAYTQF